MPAKTPRARRGPKSQRLAEKRLRQLLIELDEEGGPQEARWCIPEDWATLEDDIDVAEPKVKVTLRLDATVAKFYRTMGQGYQARINRVLETYAQMKIAQVRWYEGSLARVRHQTQVEAMGWDKGGDIGIVEPDWPE